MLTLLLTVSGGAVSAIFTRFAPHESPEARTAAGGNKAPPSARPTTSKSKIRVRTLNGALVNGDHNETIVNSGELESGPRESAHGL
ncbi:hypothetical protein ACIRSS_23025 [Amycolatopsis sp. NPDC101161]|uniref:hypothetical protein n=1 Tax=Amycolatopsis sp. NPDC101161 TaxID=3363940 RepID=UPI0037FF75DF